MYGDNIKIFFEFANQIPEIRCIVCIHKRLQITYVFVWVIKNTYRNRNFLSFSSSLVVRKRLRKGSVDCMLYNVVLFGRRRKIDYNQSNDWQSQAIIDNA